MQWVDYVTMWQTQIKYVRNKNKIKNRYVSYNKTDTIEQSCELNQYNNKVPLTAMILS